MFLLKPILMAVLTWWAVSVLTGQGDIAILVAAIPLVLGLLNILTGPVYTLAALLFLGAIYVRVAGPLGLPSLDGLLAELRGQLHRLTDRASGGG